MNAWPEHRAAQMTALPPLISRGDRTCAQVHRRLRLEKQESWSGGGLAAGAQPRRRASLRAMRIASRCAAARGSGGRRPHLLTAAPTALGAFCVSAPGSRLRKAVGLGGLPPGSRPRRGGRARQGEGRATSAAQRQRRGLPPASLTSVPALAGGLFCCVDCCEYSRVPNKHLSLAEKV